MPTRKTFQMVADILQQEWHDAQTYLDTSLHYVARQTLANAANLFADEFARQNPRFDRARFLRACGLEN